MHKYLLFLLLSTTLLLASCTLVAMQGSGNVIAESREVGQFERIELCCGMQLRLTQAAPTQVTIEADDNILNHIETDVSGQTLSVRFRSNFRMANFRTTQPIVVHVQMPTIHGIAISGGGSLVTDRVESDQLALAFSGGSRAEIGVLHSNSITLDGSGGDIIALESITAETLTLKASGGTRVTIQGGTVSAQQISAQGGSQYHAAALQSESATVDVGGGSAADLWVTTALQVKASGGSRVEYRGTPSIDQQLSGGSNVRATSR